MNKAILLDRDGTINVDYGYVSDPNKFELLPNTIAGLIKLQSLGYRLIIVSNQSGIGRGYYSLSDYEAVTKKMISELSLQNIEIAECFYCPHSPESNCDCRKPRTKMVDEAIQKWDIDTSKSFFIGDKESDVKVGIKTNLKTILVYNKTLNIPNFNQSYTVKDLLEASNYIENQL